MGILIFIYIITLFMRIIKYARAGTQLLLAHFAKHVVQASTDLPPVRNAANALNGDRYSM